MRRAIIPAITLVLAVMTGGPASGAHKASFGLDVLVDGVLRPEYAARGTIYIEALRGRDYVLRVTNPLPVRVGVALSVDGLNTIDARHTDARSAAKWVLEPYETVEIAGWQVNGAEARSFYFTGERSSYGAWLGETDNLGAIEAVFFRERARPIPIAMSESASRDAGRARGGAGDPGAPAPSAADRKEAQSVGAAPLSEEYAATGIGERRRHEVTWVHLELEREPTAIIRLRYEFRDQLERLGVLRPYRQRTPLDRREGASGFGDYCPDPPGR